MRICLFWNATAGEGTSLDRLTALISRAGHRVAQVVEDASDLPAEMSGIDCVVAAGGDGTVARAGRVLAGGAVPLAILPLGTANNIASSLGLDSDIERLVQRWHENHVATIDVGAVVAGNTTSYFLESVGCGLATACIAEGRETLSKGDRDSHLVAARDLYIETLRGLRGRPYQIKIDDEEISGEFLLVEILNTPSIGPLLQFAADASAADGFLSVVVAAESAREALDSYLAALKTGTAADAGLRSWRARTIEISGADHIHIDDRATVVDGSPIEVRVHPSALSILA